MRVEVRLFATLERYLPPGSHRGVGVVDVPDRSTAADVARLLGIPARLEHVLLVNGQPATADQILADGDALDLYPPLSGG